MANTDLIIPIVVAAVGLLGSGISLIVAWFSQKRAQQYSEDIEALKKRLDRGETVWTLTEKYSQPLLVAAYDLQQRIFELVEYPISRQHLEKKEGLDDIKIFTCYLLAQYLAYTHILRTKTGYLSFSEDDGLRKLRTLMYTIDEELDRRRGSNGINVGVWPTARILVCERMLIKSADLSAALDGGFGIGVKGLDDFRKEWPTKFQEPMGYFCEWIDLMLEGRLQELTYKDAPLRCLQHLLVDLVSFLDRDGAYITRTPSEELMSKEVLAAKLKCKKSAIFCDCSAPNCKKELYKQYEGTCGGLALALRDRQDTRRNDPGLLAHNGLRPFRTQNEYDDTDDWKIDLKEVKKMTMVVDLK